MPQGHLSWVTHFWKFLVSWNCWSALQGFLKVSAHSSGARWWERQCQQQQRFCCCWRQQQQEHKPGARQCCWQQVCGSSCQGGGQGSKYARWTAAWTPAVSLWGELLLLVHHPRGKKPPQAAAAGAAGPLEGAAATPLLVSAAVALVACPPQLAPHAFGMLGNWLSGVL
jgi:hypothetical protein